MLIPPYIGQYIRVHNGKRFWIIDDYYGPLAHNEPPYAFSTFDYKGRHRRIERYEIAETQSEDPRITKQFKKGKI
jgi:hypothetical protein